MRLPKAPPIRSAGATQQVPTTMGRHRQTILAVALVVAASVALLIELPSRSAPKPFDATWKLLNEQRFNGGISSAWNVYAQTSANPELNRLNRYVSVSDGVLELETRDQFGSGLCWCSGRYRAVRYGRFEVRARFLGGPGHGDAILLWPADQDWPAGGEIDLSEIHSQGDFANSSASSVHYTSANRQIIATDVGDFSTWTTYAVEWLPTEVRVWVGGRLVLSVTDPAAIPHTPMFFALQAGPDTTSKVPNGSAVLEVQWVKYFAP